MFGVKLHPTIRSVGDRRIRFADGSDRPAPPQLDALAALTSEWQSHAALIAAGLADWQIELLLRHGVACFGEGEFVFPRWARSFLESQFPALAAARPIGRWLSDAVPSAVWIGLPHTNLANLRHSTAIGLAEVIDALGGAMCPVIAVLPYQAPSPNCAADLCPIIGLSAACGFRLGVLGGDHRATWSVVSEIKGVLPPCRVRYIHVDAHHDLYGIETGGAVPVRTLSHSNFLIDLLATGAVDEAIVLGCRDRPGALHTARKMGFNVTAVSDPARIPPVEPSALPLHTHLSVDIDVLDPEIGRSVSSPLGGGWTAERLFDTVAQIVACETIDGCSIVEAGGGCERTTDAVVRLVGILGGDR